MAGKNEIKEILENIHTGKILYDEPMFRHTSLSVGGSADALVMIENEDQLMEVVTRLEKEKIKYFPAGNLTNVIVRDGGYRGAILLLTSMKEVSCEHTKDNGGLIYAQAGAGLSKVVNLSVAEELSGFEFCAGIPGSIGGAVWMNAGAYGREIKDVIESVTVMDAEGNRKIMKKEDISFSYRKTSFPADTIILKAGFKLEKGERWKIKEKINDILQSRQEKHPLDFPSAGSIFKNIPGQPAGKLIEDLGLKGITAGGAQISPKHGNFIINRNKATASDVLTLIELIQFRAKQEKGVDLETEVVVIGEDSC
jgi:UDP-N-acetylmuramate dehydrogenase